MLITNIKDAYEECAKINDLIKTNTEIAGIIVHDNIDVVYGFNNDINKEYCEANNINEYYFPKRGGAIVQFPGSITLGSVYNIDFKGGLCERWTEDLKTYLQSRLPEHEITCTNNDILVDGYKVAAGVETRFPSETNHWSFFAYIISINSDLDVIKNVCKKPMIKIPKGLSEYGIGTKEVADWVKAWFKEHDIK